MAGMALLNPVVDNKHRAKLMQDNVLQPLITRGQKDNWQIHPAWIDR
jgi:hypothetical protein